jgi:molybdate transport system ATP-binding protein
MADALIVDIEKKFPSGAVVAAQMVIEMRGGRTVVLFGPSGVGKTTVVRSLAGIERPERGRIRFGGATWFDARERVWIDPQDRSVGHVAQDSALFPHLTVRDNIAYGLSGTTAAGRQSRVEEMIALLELTNLARRYPRELSGGQSRRVAIARALARRPRLLLLDEPFSALDAPARARLRVRLREVIRGIGISALVVTHDRTDAIALGDEIAVFAEGRIRQIGAVADVFRRPGDVVVARTVGVESVIPARVEKVVDGLVEVRVGGAIVRAVDANLEAGRTDVVACIRAEDVIVERDAQPGGSARNHLAGRVVAIEAEGPLERVTIDCGFPLTALITRNAKEEMSLEEGASVVAVVKATSVHLI